jgi:hypothetical protein
LPGAFSGCPSRNKIYPNSDFSNPPPPAGGLCTPAERVIMLLKFTGKNGETHGGYKWPLPTKNADGTWKPGKWTRKITGQLEACENGYHYTDSDWCAAWIDAELYEVEISGETISSSVTPVKHVCRRARLVRKIETWNDKIARLFAVRCARDAISFVKNPDPRSIAAIDTAEKYANGQATGEDLAAARDAAWDAARDAAWDAARDAARDAAWDAARDAARDAAWAAARAAAWAAAWDAARAAALQKYSGWLLEAIS